MDQEVETTKYTNHTKYMKTWNPFLLSANEVGGLEPFGKRRKEFGEAEGPRGPSELAASESLGRGEVVRLPFEVEMPLSSILSPLLCRGARKMTSVTQRNSVFVPFRG
jgi:hypothetical protein